MRNVKYPTIPTEVLHADLRYLEYIYRELDWQVESISYHPNIPYYQAKANHFKQWMLVVRDEIEAREGCAPVMVGSVDMTETVADVEKYIGQAFHKFNALNIPKDKLADTQDMIQDTIDDLKIAADRAVTLLKVVKHAREAEHRAQLAQLARFEAGFHS